jgi:hypothetical protein
MADRRIGELQEDGSTAPGDEHRLRGQIWHGHRVSLTPMSAAATARDTIA